MIKTMFLLDMFKVKNLKNLKSFLRCLTLSITCLYICATCFGLYLGHPQDCQNKYLTKGVIIKI